MGREPGFIYRLYDSATSAHNKELFYLLQIRCSQDEKENI